MASFACNVCHEQHYKMPMGYRVPFPVGSYPDGAVDRVGAEKNRRRARIAFDALPLLCHRTLG